jgi:hypothetical protein
VVAVAAQLAAAAAAATAAKAVGIVIVAAVVAAAAVAAAAVAAAAAVKVAAVMEVQRCSTAFTCVICKYMYLSHDSICSAYMSPVGLYAKRC